MDRFRAFLLLVDFTNEMEMMVSVEDGGVKSTVQLN